MEWQEQRKGGTVEEQSGTRLGRTQKRKREKRDSLRAEWDTNWDSWLRKLTPLYWVALDTFLSSQTRVTPYFFLLYFIYTVYTTIVFMFVICVPSLWAAMLNAIKYLEHSHDSKYCGDNFVKLSRYRGIQFLQTSPENCTLFMVNWRVTDSTKPPISNTEGICFQA